MATGNIKWYTSARNIRMYELILSTGLPYRVIGKTVGNTFYLEKLQYP